MTGKKCGGGKENIRLPRLGVRDSPWEPVTARRRPLTFDEIRIFTVALFNGFTELGLRT